MPGEYRRGGGERSGRDRADTNYGAMRPREGLARGERAHITQLKMTKSRPKDITGTRSSAGAGSSAKQEGTSGNPAQFTLLPTKFWSDNAGVSGLTGGQVLDDVRTTFDLDNDPLEDSIEAFYNGNRLVEGKDFTVSGNTITWIIGTPSAPPAIGVLSGFYWYDTETS